MDPQTREALLATAAGGAGGAGLGALAEWLMRGRVTWRGPTAGGLTGLVAPAAMSGKVRAGLKTGFDRLRGKAKPEAGPDVHTMLVEAAYRQEAGSEWYQAESERMLQDADIPVIAGKGPALSKALHARAMAREWQAVDKAMLGVYDRTKSPERAVEYGNNRLNKFDVIAGGKEAGDSYGFLNRAHDSFKRNVVPMPYGVAPVSVIGKGTKEDDTDVIKETLYDTPSKLVWPAVTISAVAKGHPGAALFHLGADAAATAWNPKGTMESIRNDTKLRGDEGWGAMGAAVARGAQGALQRPVGTITTADAEILGLGLDAHRGVKQMGLGDYLRFGWSGSTAPTR
jgi:hypothetical protein